MLLKTNTLKIVVLTIIECLIKTTIIFHLKKNNLNIPKELISLFINQYTVSQLYNILLKMIRFVCRIVSKLYRYLLMIWRKNKSKTK